MIEKTFVEQFTKDWIEDWNSHDIGRILSHYADDFEMHSPAIFQVTGEPSGMLKGKAAVGDYWQNALQLVPDLEFELLGTFSGINTIALYYKGAWSRMVIEILHFRADRKVSKAYAHYAELES